jgi:hypothetical protein
LVSITVSFLSLVLSSVKLFYSQRIGIFLEPSIKVIIFIAPLIALQLLFPMFSIILMAAYIKEYAIVWITINILVTVAALHSNCCFAFGTRVFERSLNGSSHYLSTKYYIAIFTSWISPCTVWSNTHKFKSSFLIVSSLVSLTAHAVGILSIYLLTHFGYLLRDLSQYENPPLTHCFRNHDNISLR